MGNYCGPPGRRMPSAISGQLLDDVTLNPMMGTYS